MQQPHPHAWPFGTLPGTPRGGSAGSVMSSPVVTIDAGVSLEQALSRMVEHGIHHLLVTDRERIVAVVSDRDLQRGLGLGPSHRDDERHRRRPLFQVASYRLVTIAADAPIPEAAEALLAHHVSALPVVDASGDREPTIVGILTSRDLLRHLASGVVAPQQENVRPAA